ncbi:MAG TPA: GDSL-type esterase/lipase family protein [Ruminiclostridium sp.]
MLKKIMWYGIVVIAFIGFITLSLGFYQALTISSGKAKTASKISLPNANGSLSASQKANQLNITIMGDSIARGAGDITGKGFTQYLPEDLKNKTSKDLSIEDVGIDGYRSVDILSQLQSGKLDNLLKNSDFILISIGGNDIRTIQSQSETNKDQSFKALQDKYLSDLKASINIIRKSSQVATIVFLGSYNPYLKTSSVEDTRIINLWNSNTDQLIESDPHAVFVPTYDLIKYNIDKYIALDGLHPNTEGYKAISSRIAEAIEGLVVSK